MITMNKQNDENAGVFARDWINRFKPFPNAAASDIQEHTNI